MTIKPDAVSTNPLIRQPPAESWRSRLVVFLGYFALSIVFTWPLILHLRDGVIQRVPVPVDAGQNLWNLWWTRYALLNGQNPLSTQYLFYPDTVNLFWQTLGLPNALMVFPLLAASGPVIAFNLIELLSFGFGGYFAYRIARSVFNDRFAALISGFVFAFSPYHMQPIWSGSLEIVAIHWIALYVLMLMRALGRPTLLNTLGAAAALAATTLSSHYYGLFCAVYTVAHVGLAILFLPAWRARLSVFATAVAVALLWCGLLLPFVWPPEELGAAVLRDWYERQTFHSAELVDFVAPNVLHPLWGDLSLAWLSSLHRFGPESGAGAGIAVYALAGWGVVRYRRCAWPWLALALLMAVLALGPELTFGGKPSGIPLPFRLLDVVGPFRNSSRPSRIIAVMMLPLSISAGFGMEALRTGIRRRGRLLAVCAGLLIFVEYMVKPWNILQFNVDPLYMSLNNDPAPGAVIELPPLNDDGRYMVNQMCHGRPLVGGYLARAPIHSVVASPSVLRHLWDATPIPADIWSYDAAGELATLGIRFITLHLADLSPAEVTQLHRLLATPGLTLRSEGNQIETYDVDPQAARPLLLPTQGWYAPETNGQRTWRWIGDEARARLFVPTDGAISLSFTGTAYQSPRKLRVRIDDRLQSEYDVLADTERSMSISFIIPAGEHSLSLESEAVASPDGRRISVSLSHVGISSAGVAPASPRALEPPPVIAQTAGPPCQ